MNKDKLAKEIADTWRDNCPDDDFYDNCMNTIIEELELGEGPMPDEVYEIWNIIEEKYIGD